MNNKKHIHNLISFLRQDLQSVSFQLNHERLIASRQQILSPDYVSLVFGVRVVQHFTWPVCEEHLIVCELQDLAIGASLLP